MKTCRRCQHFVAGGPLTNGEGEEYPAGHCYLNPPVALVSGDSVHWMRPVVGADDRACGWFSTGLEGVRPTSAPLDGDEDEEFVRRRRQELIERGTFLWPT